ncbi:MAG TPA: hypothetical protein PK971_15405 [Saprospiraceae bacterium]|nr:hypothetical protein [Saprospiraceae bacterium]
MSEQQNSRAYAIVIALLLLAAAGIGYFFWQKSQRYLAEAEHMEAEKKQLEIQKAQIEHSLDSLSMTYSDLRSENETLKGTVTSTAAQVEQKEIVIRQIKASSSKELQELRNQVAELQKVKIELETIIATLRGETEQLKAQNAALTAENETLKGEKTELSGKVADLAKQLEAQIRKTQSATFKATSFRVALARRNENKLTAKARRARSIDVSFDLADVPEPYRGAQKLYMAIMDERNTPILAERATKVTIHAPTGPVEIQAQETKDVVLTETQRLSFSHKFDDRLKAGNYVVGIYCDKGLLGVSSFKLY